MTQKLGCSLFFHLGSFTDCWPQYTLIVQCATHERTDPASYFWAGVHRAPYRSASVPAARTLRLWRQSWLFAVFLSSSESPRAQPWGPSPRFWSFSPVSEILDVNPRRPVRVDNLCWRTSVSSVIPPALSATGMSCLNALPVELVSEISYTCTFSTALNHVWKKANYIYIKAVIFVTIRCTSGVWKK